ILWAFLTAGLVLTPAASKKAEVEKLFNGKNLVGWKLINPTDAKRNRWSVVGSVKLKEGMPGQFEPAKGTGVLLNGGDGHGQNLLTAGVYGDCALHVEFNVSKGSNSGVYLMGHYEGQILDSYGKKDKDLKYGDCGGIYDTAPPRMNASKAPGEWQTFDI